MNGRQKMDEFTSKKDTKNWLQMINYVGMDVRIVFIVILPQTEITKTYYQMSKSFKERLKCLRTLKVLKDAV